MNLILLSGNSKRNQEWIYEVEKQIGDLFGNTYVHDYMHWETGDEWINLPHELDQLKQHVPSEPYGIFAKSIGTVLAMQSIDQEILLPQFMVLCGLPLSYIKESCPEFSQKLAEAGIPVVIVHNNQDTVGSAVDVREYLGETIYNYTFIETVGNHHDYEDYRLLRTQLEKLVNRQPTS